MWDQEFQYAHRGSRGIITSHSAPTQKASVGVYSVCAGTDPEILHERWLMGWLPIVNYTDARGVAG